MTDHSQRLQNFLVAENVHRIIITIIYIYIYQRFPLSNFTFHIFYAGLEAVLTAHYLHAHGEAVASARAHGYVSCICVRGYACVDMYAWISGCVSSIRICMHVYMHIHASA